MTREYRDWLRRQIDQERRARLRRQPSDQTRDRAAYCAAWHQANRERRLQAGRERRQRLKDAA